MMGPLAILSTHPIQYQAPLFRRLAAGGIPVHVFFASRAGLERTYDPEFGIELEWDIPLLEGYDSEFLTDSSELGKSIGTVRLFSKLRRGRYSALIIHGYRPPGMIVGALAAKANGLPVMYRSESNLLISPLTTQKRAAGVVLKRLVHTYLSIGTENDRFYAALGIPAADRVLVPYAVDNERFAREVREGGRDAARIALGLAGDDVVALFVGKLVPWKRPELFIGALAALPSLRAVVVGEGVMRQRLEREAEANQPGQVLFTGFLNQSEMARAYACADLLVLPSDHEPWGLVVNEAMSCGLPVLVSSKVGAGADLVTGHETGAVFEAGSLDDLILRLRDLTEDVDRLRELGANARMRMAGWSLDADVEGIREALSMVGAR